MAQIEPLRGGATSASRGLIVRSESFATGDYTFAHRSQQKSSPIQQSDDWKAAPHGRFRTGGRLSTICLTIGCSHDKTPHFDRVKVSPSQGNSVHLCLQKDSPLTQNDSPSSA